MSEKKKDRMGQAYDVSGRLFRETLGKKRPADERELAAVEPSEVVAVHGTYDHIHRVLDATGVPYTGVAPDQLARVDWDRLQVLFINCPGELPRGALSRIAPWVRRGGYLVTTDWALKHVIEPLFPGTIRHNGKQTSDCVVRVRMEDDETDPLLQGFLENDRDPLWWLEGASYPVQILDPNRVRVLVRSKEVGDQWGDEPVVVTFEEGDGTVLHLMSHLYLQRSETRTVRDAMAPEAYFQMEMGLTGPDSKRYADLAAGLNASDLRAAWSKGRMMSNVVLESRRKRKQRREATQKNTGSASDGAPSDGGTAKGGA